MNLGIIQALIDTQDELCPVIANNDQIRVFPTIGNLKKLLIECIEVHCQHTDRKKNYQYYKYN